jgi:8-oxo-dGTP pyrophosphatase MutT (NUDIX family)
MAGATGADRAWPEWMDRLVRAARQLQEWDFARMPPPAEGGRPAAVLMALSHTDDGPGLLLIERAASMRTHAGQVAFPGGAADPDDADPAATALREAAEEVGLDPATVVPAATLPALYLPPSGFVVRPVLAWWAAPHPVGVVDAAEVASVAVVPIAELVAPANRFRVAHPSGYIGPGFSVDGLFIWGFTGGLVDGLLRLGGWAQEWDPDVLRPVPETSETLGTVEP